MGRFAGETACATTKDQHLVKYGGAGVQPARAFFRNLLRVFTAPAVKYRNMKSDDDGIIDTQWRL
jgi:hypothetical protein